MRQKIQKWLKKENIHLSLKAASELETIRTMTELASRDPNVLDTRILAQSIYDNELHSSHRGCSGITFTALTNAVSEPVMIVGRFEKGIGYFFKKYQSQSHCRS